MASFFKETWLNYPPELATISPALFTTYVEHHITTIETWVYDSSSVCGAFTYPDRFVGKSQFTTTLTTTVYEPKREFVGWRPDPCTVQLNDCTSLEHAMSTHLPAMWSEGAPLGITGLKWPWCKTEFELQTNTHECASSAGPATVYYWRDSKPRDMCASKPAETLTSPLRHGKFNYLSPCARLDNCFAHTP